MSYLYNPSVLFGKGGQDVILFIGDSFVAGNSNSTGYGPTPASGTAFQWDNSSAIIPIGATDVVTATTNNGTMIPQFCIDYYSNTGRPVIAIPRGSGGSSFLSIGGSSNNWSSTGILRAAAESAVNACLAAAGATKLRAIIVGSLGINDASETEGAHPIASVLTQMDAFYAWLQATYPGVQILTTTPGRTTSVTFNSRLYAIRNKTFKICYATSGIDLVWQYTMWLAPGYYGADNLHGTITGLNYTGSGMARWFTAELVYSKWARSHFSSLYTNLSTFRKGLLDAFYVAQAANGNLPLLEYGLFAMAPDANSIYFDLSWVGLTIPVGSPAVSLNNHIATNGTSDQFNFTFRPSINNDKASTSDFIFYIKLKSNDHGTSSGYMVGTGTNTNAMRIGQRNTPDVAFFANQNGGTIFTSPFSSLRSGHGYGVFRSGGTTRGFIEDTTVITSGSQAVTTPTETPVIGGSFDGTSVTSRFAGKYTYAFAAKYTTLNLSGLIGDSSTPGTFEYLEAHWND